MKWLCLASVWLASTLCAQPSAPPRSTLGKPFTIEGLVLPAPRVAPAPSHSKSVAVVRMVNVEPHGTAFRYTFEVSAYEAGDHDLRSFLIRPDGSPTTDLPAIPFSISAVLAPGTPPNKLSSAMRPSLGGYKDFVIAAMVAWVVGLFFILRWRWQRKRSTTAERESVVTLAERLQPLVERAVRGELPKKERAQLELLLVGFWRKKLSLEDRRPHEVLRHLREHVEASPLILGLERWLHRPEPEATVDIAALLQPYASLPAEAHPSLEVAEEAGT